MERVQATQVATLRALIANERFLAVDDATKLTLEVHNGPWSPDENVTLIAAISDAASRVAAPTSSAAREAPARRNFNKIGLSLDKKRRKTGEHMSKTSLTHPKEDAMKRG